MSETDHIKHLRDRASDLLNEFGNDVPDWLRARWNALADAVNAYDTANDLAGEKPFKIGVLWGSKEFRKDAEVDEPILYEFATKAELDAFTRGVSESEGYLDHEFVDLNPDGSWPTEEVEEE